MSKKPVQSIAQTQEELCDLLLKVAGLGLSRMADARRHVEVLDAAIPHMTKAQAKLARQRIRKYEDKWGPLLPGDHENQADGEKSGEETPYVEIVARWLSRRKYPERLLRVLRRAVNCMSVGETRLTRIMDFAYEEETDLVIHPVGYDSFRQWLIELRLGKPEGAGHWVAWKPGMCAIIWQQHYAWLEKQSLMALEKIKMGRGKKQASQ